MTGKKSQIRIAESMAVVVIFFMLLFFGYSFYIRQQQVSFSETLKENSQNQIIQLAQKIYFLPELQCSTGYKLVREGCYDRDKVEEFSKLMQDTSKLTFYKDILDITLIEVYQVYPSLNFDLSNTNATQIGTLYNQSALAQQAKYDSQEVIYMPISLYEPINKTYDFGYLKITYFYKTGFV